MAPPAPRADRRSRSGVLTFPRTGSCRKGRLWPPPARHDRPPREPGAARAACDHAPRGAPARQALPGPGSALAGAAYAAGPAHQDLPASAAHHGHRADDSRAARRGGVLPGTGFAPGGDPLSRRRLLPGLGVHGPVVGGAPERPDGLPGSYCPNTAWHLSIPIRQHSRTPARSSEPCPARPARARWWCRATRQAEDSPWPWSCRCATQGRNSRPAASCCRRGSISAATEELLAPDAELLAASASAAEVDVTYTRWPRMWHDFALQPGLLAAADSALAQASWFVSKVTASR